MAWRVLFQLAPAGGRQRRDMAQELADWLAASEGIIPSGNGVVAGSASLIRGPPTDPAWAHSEPTVNAAKLVANSTPYLGVFGQRHALGGVERQ
ncbi:hypothetical protein ACNJGN_02965 [Mycobacterium tuberculosis]